MSKYTEFDELLIQSIKAGRNTFTTMQTREMINRATPLAPVDRFGARNEFRVFDRRLQALRKAGKIRYKKGVWHVIEDAQAGAAKLAAENAKEGT